MSSKDLKIGRNASSKSHPNVVPNAKLINIILFFGGLGASIYQTVLLLQTFITQPTITTMVPYHSASLERPDVVICKNIYSELLALNQLNYSNIDLFRRVAIQSGDDAPFVVSPIANLLNLSLVDSQNIEQNLKTVGEKYLRCGSMLGNCTVLISGLPMAPPVDCCSVAVQHIFEFSVCYRISSNQPQQTPGKFSTAIYQLRYPTEGRDKRYTVQLVQKNKYANIYEAPLATVAAETEMKVEIQKQVSVRTNYTEKCTTDPARTPLECLGNAVEMAVQNECQCKLTLPLTTSPDKVRQNNFRFCLPFEKVTCLLRVKGTKATEMTEKMANCERYKFVCRDVRFDAKLSSVTLSKSFDAYMYGEMNIEEPAIKTSMVYVYYGSMTVLYNKEVRTLSWNIVISSLGGVWGLWLGLSLYGITRIFFVGLFQLYSKLIITGVGVHKNKLIYSKREHLTIELAGHGNG